MQRKMWVVLFVLYSLMANGCAVNPAERISEGNSQYNQSNYEEALLSYQAAQVARPDDLVAYLNAANAYARLGDIENALQSYQQVLKNDDAELSIQAYFNMGNLFFEAKRYGEAVRSYQQVLLRRSDDEDARHNLELALKALVDVSPTPTTSAETPISENALETQTPTLELPNAATATPVTNNPMPQNTLSSPDTANLPPTYSLEEAESLLDAIQQSQQTFSLMVTGTPAQTTSGKDW
ncbi:MAG: tetratricopeptide repeat protein [Chloroflexi bacterium]|nr:tetratricopeptide repeat protein [Chloroflexota bacterium]MCC6891228.1 tetratricopeptide repeat protein [Anaerolineae bacterium]